MGMIKTAQWACPGDRVMGCSGGKHRATRRQVMGCSREDREGRQMAGVDPRHRQGNGPAQASTAPAWIAPGSCQALFLHCQRSGESTRLPVLPALSFGVFEMWTIPGGTEKLLNTRVQGSPLPQHCHASRPCPLLLLECLRGGADGRQVTSRFWEGFNLGQGKKIANGPCCSSAISVQTPLSKRWLDPAQL